MSSLARKIKRHGHRKANAEPAVRERLDSAAIIRDGCTHSAFRSHYRIRAALGDDNPQASNLNDVEGFVTSAGRFVDRYEAQDIALAAGQIRARMDRELLSSDINW